MGYWYRWSPLTIPNVTVGLKSVASMNGFPIASVHSPTLSLSLSPISTQGKLSSPRSFMTATSPVGSTPTITASYRLPSGMPQLISSPMAEVTW